MAEVFRAKATGAHGFEKTLAIKRILPDLARDPEFEQRFINEAKLAVKLSHANVVQVFDFGRFAGSLFIAMEYVEGLDLAAFLKVYRNRDDSVTIASALYIAIEMARGLNFAHQRNVIHRDVSPSNILLSRAGEVKIADFGIAEAVAKKHREGKRSGRIMGKWRYMSPEQTRAEPLTIASDVFAAAAVMYEVFTGVKLFPGDEADDIIQNIHSMEIPKPSELRPGLPPRIDEILGKALARDRDERPSAADILRELLDISYDSTIVASALGVSEAVADVLGAQAEDDSGDQIGLDNLIRAQLVDAEGRAPTIRKTAVGEPTQTAQAVVRRGVDADGITILEVDDTLAANPIAMRGERRETAQPFEESQRDPAITAPIVAVADRRRTWPWALAIAAVAVTAGGGAWWAARNTDSEIERLPVANGTDVGSEPRRSATVTIESEPPSADVLIDGVIAADPTPLTREIESGVSHQIKVRLEGYEPAFERDLVLRPGQDFLMRPRLRKLRATLDVRTRPDGAVVTLDGVTLGETPLFRSALSPGSNRKLKITRADYKTIERSINLEVGRPTLIDEKLVSTIVYTTVKINIIETERGGWADVFHAGKPVGRVSGSVRLPVGKQRITLKNKETGVSKTVKIDVQLGRSKIYSFKL